MNRESAEEVFGLLVRVFGLLLAYTQLLYGFAVTANSFTGFVWWLTLIAVVWFLLFRADVLVHLCYRHVDAP